MTKQEQRIAIGKECGWEWSGTPRRENADVALWSRCGDVHERSLPSWPDDLNAMHEAEKALNSAVSRVNYTVYLSRILGWNPEDCPFTMLHATAAQRSEAFLRCLGKWKD